MAKPAVDRDLAEAWLEAAVRSRRDRRRGEPWCWLAQFDKTGTPCSEKIEGIHLIGRQRIRNVLTPLVVPAEKGIAASPTMLIAFIEDVVRLAEWDPRNASLGCEVHHRRFDSHATPELLVPRSALTPPFFEFAEERGLESEVERKFPEAL
jgi:hypothetical protein